MKKLLLSIVSAFLLFTLSAQVSDDFSDYTVGGKLAQQAQAAGRDYWTTWSNLPGGNEDGVIAEQPAGNKCLKLIAPNNDQILRLGDKNGTIWYPKTTGKWELTFKIFIPTGKDGYFNIKNTFPSTVSETWAMQIYMGTDEDPTGTGQPGPATPGVGKVYGGSETGASFNFSHDTWVPIKIFIDLDDDVAEFYVNNTLAHTYQYSTGSFGLSNHRMIAAFNIFPPNVAATSEFYVDDIVFAPVSSGSTVIFETNFDELANGAFVAQSYPDFFRTWEDLPGTTQDAVITTEQAQSTPHAAKLAYAGGTPGGTDLIFKAGALTSGIYTVDFDMYIPNAAPAYFNLLQIFDPSGTGQNSTWAVGVYFNIPASGGPSGVPQGTNIHNNGVYTPFTAPSNAWFPVKMYIDLDMDVAKATINNNEILTWKYSDKENGGVGTRQLDAVDFFPIMTGSVYFIDNFVFTSWGGDSEPIMNVTPTSITEMIVPGGTVTKTITVANTGTSMGDYFSSIVFDLEEPPGGTGSYTLAHCTDAPHPNLNLGFASDGYAELGVQFSGNDICDKIGSFINKMSYYLKDEVGDNKLIFRIYEGAGPATTGEILMEFTKTNAIPGAWNEITLPTPVLITGELWLSVGYTQVNSILSIGHDDSAQKPGVNWLKRSVEASTWSQFWEGGASGAYGNIMIKAQTEGGTIPACWISFSGESYGSVPKQSTKTYDVVLDAAGLTEGTYTADIHVTTSDVKNPLFIIPCTITVGTSSAMTVTPATISETIKFPVDELTVEVTIKNNGNIAGDYTVQQPTVDWLTLSGDTQGTLAPAASKTFNAIFNIDSTFENKAYTTEIKITTTDATNGTKTIPCTLTVSGVSVGEYTIQTLVFPNPATGMVQIQSNTIINYIELFNNVGQRVYYSTINGDHTSFDTSNFSAGLYFVKVNTDKGSQTVKLMVQ